MCAGGGVDIGGAAAVVFDLRELGELFEEWQSRIVGRKHGVEGWREPMHDRLAVLGVAVAVHVRREGIGCGLTALRQAGGGLAKQAVGGGGRPAGRAVRALSADCVRDRC